LIHKSESERYRLFPHGLAHQDDVLWGVQLH
jgi:hypothetical protein